MSACPRRSISSWSTRPRGPGPSSTTRRRGLEDLQTHLKEIGRPSEHPWWGVGRDSHLLPNDLKQLVGQIDGAILSLETIVDAVQRLADALAVPVPDALSLRDVKRLSDLGLKLMNAPAMDHRQMANPVWETRRDEIVRIVEQGQALAAGQSALAETASPLAWQTDLEATRRGLAAHGHSWFRWLRRDYRKAMATLRGILKGELPKRPGRAIEDRRRRDRDTDRDAVARRRPRHPPARPRRLRDRLEGHEIRLAATGRHPEMGRRVPRRPARG